MSSASFNLKNLVISNTYYNLIGYVFRMAIGLFLTPFIIQSLGSERFGIWAVTAVITGYLGLFDLGIGASLVKYLSVFYSRKEPEKISAVISTSFSVYFCLTCITLLVFFVFGKQILSLLKIPQHIRPEALTTMWISLFVFGCSTSLYAFSVIPCAMQRFDIVNIVSVCFAILSSLCTFFILKNGYGLIGMAIGSACVSLVNHVANVCIAYSLIPTLNFSPLKFHKATFFELFHFGISMQIARISSWISTQVDKILIGTFLSVGLITHYEVGSLIVNYALGISYLLVSALLPAFSQIQSQQKDNSNENLIEAYLTAFQHGALILLPIFIFLAISSELIVRTWMGGDIHELASATLTVLSIGFAINALAQIPASMCMAIGKPIFLSVGSLIVIILNLLLSFIFLKQDNF